MPAVTTLNRTGLADALFSQTRQKVLRLFFARQERDFSAKELIEQAGAGWGAVQNKINLTPLSHRKLGQMDFLFKKRNGRDFRPCRLVIPSPIFEGRSGLQSFGFS
jgi:hypothetical protein